MIAGDSIRTLNDLDPEQKAIALAIGIVLDRLRRLPKEDSDDLFGIFKDYANCTTAEERIACNKAIMEILEQAPVEVRRMTLSADDEHTPDDLVLWVKHVSSRIKQFRTEASLTQDQLAEASGLPQSHISRIENGKHSPSRTTLEKIAAALKVSLCQLDPSAETDENA